MRRLLRSWRRRVAVGGHSMAPTLRDGDWLLVDPDAYQRRWPAIGDLVVAADPRAPDRLLVKRVAHVDPDGRLTLAGDHPAHLEADPGELPAVSSSALHGRPWFRYWPPHRAGRTR
jgi:signal peptidase I